jgi:hypothetical protein
MSSAIEVHFCFFAVSITDGSSAAGMPKPETGSSEVSPVIVALSCQVAEHCWDPVGHAIMAYGYLFKRLIQARQREV